MKPSLISLILFTLIILIGCKAQERAAKDICTKEGVIIFAPTLNASYFFPFKNHQVNLDISDFINQEYDTGFMVTWYQAKWREEIMDNYSMAIPDDNTFKAVAYVAVEYSPLESFAEDSLYSFAIERSGTERNFIYDNKPREFTNIKGLK